MSIPIPVAVAAAPSRSSAEAAKFGVDGGSAEWKVHGADASVVHTFPSAAADDGLGLHVGGAATAQPYWVESPAVFITAGREYRVTFWARRRTAAARLEVCLRFSDGNGSTLEPRSEAAGGGTQHVRFDPWFDRYVLKAVAPERSRLLSLRIDIEGAPDLSADFDDFSVAEAESSAHEPTASRWRPLAHRDQAAGQIPPAIVLKLDDLQGTNEGVEPRWQKVADFLAAREIKATVGVIGRSLECDRPGFLRWIVERHQSGALEFWNHGLDHAEWQKAGAPRREFSGTSYAHQRQHLRETNRLAQEKLGFPFTAFGAPFNATDDTTVAVLREEPGIAVWLYGDLTTPASKTVLGRAFAVNIEQPVLVPNFARFLEGYAHNRAERYFVLQGHPSVWDDEQFAEFARVIDFLVEEKARFLFSAELAAELREES